jgi:glycosyltransferase involved in cell wall biosynthesis
MLDEDILTGSAVVRTLEPRRRSISVLHVAEVIKGGICTHLRDLIELQRRSFGADRITVVAPGSQTAELSLPAGVTVVKFRDGPNRILNAARAAAAVYRLVRRQPPNIVHIHSTFAGAAIRPLLALLHAHTAVVFCPHGWAFFRDLSPLKRLLVQRFERLWSHWCQAIVCVSRHERLSAVQVGIPSEKLVVVQNGLPRQRPQAEPLLLEWPQGARRLLFVGRFDRQKGVDVLFEALRQLGADAFAYIVGDSLRTTLDVLPANARCAGWMAPPALESYYRSAEVIVMPSRWEGFPLVALEAMRAGLAIIATNVGGLPEIVEDGETGLLIPPNDAGALVEAIRSLDSERLKQMGLAAAERFSRRWTSEASHRLLSDLYRRTMRRPRPAAMSWHADFGTDRLSSLSGQSMLGT